MKKIGSENLVCFFKVCFLVESLPPATFMDIHPSLRNISYKRHNRQQFSTSSKAAITGPRFFRFVSLCKRVGGKTRSTTRSVRNRRWIFVYIGGKLLRELFVSTLWLPLGPTAFGKRHHRLNRRRYGNTMLIPVDVCSSTARSFQCIPNQSRPVSRIAKFKSRRSYHGRIDRRTCK